MALLEDQIEEAQAAFLAAHEAKDTAGAQALADHVRSLQAQKAEIDKAVTESSEAGTDLRNPMIAAGVGAVAGAAVNPIRGAVHNIITPPAAPPKMSAPPPSSLSGQLGQGGENWTKSLTGVDIPNAQMNKGSLDTAQRMAATVGRGGELAGGRITEGGIMLPPEVGAKPAAPAPRTMASQAKQTGKSLLQGIAGEPQPVSPFSVVKGGTRGAITGAALGDIPQQLAQGNYGTAASDLGVAVGNIAHGLSKTPKGKAIGTLLGLGSGALRGYQGVNELTGQPEERAQGGLVHLAGGGQPQFGEARAYEPSYSEKIRDYAAKHIGRETANRLFAGPNARPEDLYNPVSLALQTPGAIADSAAGFIKAGQEGNYLEGMGHYLVGALNVAPFTKPVGKLIKTAIPKFAGGKGVVAEGAVDVAKKVKGFLEHTPTKPNELVGTRYKVTDRGGLIQPTPFNIESALGAKVIHRPYDLSGRNQLVEEVSGHKLLNPVLTEGGQPFGRDIKLQATGQGGASNKSINDRILKRVEAAAREGDGRVFNIPSSMTYGSEAFSNMPIDILLDLIKQRELPLDTLQYLSNLVRAKSPNLQKFVGFEHPEVAKQFTEGGFELATTPGKLRIAGTNVLTGKTNKAQELLDYNQEDLFAAIRAPELRNVPPGYMGETIMEAVPGHPGFKIGSHRAYDSGDASTYRGQGINAPISIWMPDAYKQALAEVKSAPKTAGNALGHQRAMARNVLGTAESGVAQTVTPQVADNLQRYQEAVKSGKLDPNNLDAIHKYIYGSKAEGYAPGGKVLSAIKKMSEEAQAAYKAKFTPDFYHASPSNKIKAFDTQAERNPNFLTALEEESNDLAPRGFISLTRNPKFANDYATGKNATIYPVSANLGKHLDPRLPENYDVLHQYRKNNPGSFPNYYGAPHTLPKSYREAEWSVMEDPGFLEYLKSKGYNSMTMVENGQPNVGIFNPADIRGKFAKFNPEDAADPDFMKAEGGPVQHFQAGGFAKLAKHAHSQNPKVAQALEEYLKGNISQEERIRIMNQFLPIRQWNELPPNYTDEQIRNALLSNKQSKALAPVPEGMRVGNRLDIPAYTQHGVYVDTTHDAAGKPISYNRTGHLTGVEFSSKPNQAVRVGLGTKEQALTPMGAEIGSAKSPFALIKGTNVDTKDDEVRRMMAEMMKDPRYTQIGMDPRKHSQFYDKSTGMPVFSAEEKLQSGPLILAPKKGLETTSWDDPRLNLTDFPGKKYKKGGKVRKK
jgi:hypothetical protein